MKELAGTALQEYIQNAISVETDMATQGKLKEDFINCAEQKKPVLQLIPEPKAPVAPDTEFRFSVLDVPGNKNFGVCFGVFVGIMIAVLALFVLTNSDGDGTLLSMGIVLLLISVGCTIPYYVKKRNFAEKAAQAESEFEKQFNDYKILEEETIKTNEERRIQQRINLQKWNQFNQQMDQTMSQAMEETQKTLDKLYAWDVIYPKYRNLPALTSIYEYLITGRCEGLTGPHGAYNLYEDEVRKDMVISQLSVVIQNLEQIKQNQYMLYQQVKEIQQTTNSIEKELRQIKGYSVQIASLTALNAYYSALNERNTRITMYCNV